MVGPPKAYASPEHQYQHNQSDAPANLVLHQRSSTKLWIDPTVMTNDCIGCVEATIQNRRINVRHSKRTTRGHPMLAYDGHNETAFRFNFLPDWT